ncbi:MAG: protein-methionine-sulfoxide reductase catalytic subunit MsrP [Bacteroidetes Order II. Incertae sedis bacterium]|jgi:methionine sulfoxide reductase catalytic subunit|nr:protein-methionine-sulfoxide reductase catalytic subunit MsrP [Bacteroidetes Order II. bacterium]MBT4053490.1 protein-methionine-sulfoxide reductase catalytic subunit MsrP [Bacteroidetes Order II. bacterium]MBT4602871.1 protein-methionine-sulfoxide reductase catalytic subunit MsrP [Bacteroidetes Order II. bacterium]MBT5248603.1 protein-methionine-sulfoxide reductase catalytic subunit MsrP [Bacteroidetes Order II. bacterium]MBT6200382.1 protein-methionine-sulfoxide reductase catalytic subunit
MLIKTSSPIPYSEVTDRKLFENRRDFIKKAGLATAGATLLPGTVHASKRRDDDPTPYEIVTGYNNFYEFGTGKEDPKRNAKNFKTDNWKVKVTGEVEESREWDLSEMIDGFETEQRIYRHRCVEGWSMVVPWNGFALKDLIEKLKPTAEAKYIEFTTLYDVRRMPGQSRAVLPWPYVEALRLDEAMHPLTMMVTGVYDETLPPQNGAPIRLIIPWKYGFKGGKSIVKIRFTKKQPRTTWNEAIPREYGFYANVNPEVDHPRWSQAKERRLGEVFRRETLMFNGYDEVASLYSDMDLRKYY